MKPKRYTVHGNGATPDKVQYREVHGNVGCLGLVFRFLLIGWQVLMIVWFVDSTMGISTVIDEARYDDTDAIIAGTVDATIAGAAIGAGLAWTFILFVWLVGTIILGMFVLMTRPAKTIVQTTHDDTKAQAPAQLKTAEAKRFERVLTAVFLIGLLVYLYWLITGHPT